VSDVTASPSAGEAGATAAGAAVGLPRFTAAERALHWSVAVLLGTAAITGFVLYYGPVAELVGRRILVRDVHVWTGIASPVPVVLAYAGRWRDEVRRDVRRLARWSRADRRWVLSRGREATAEVGKFNGGQKANAAFIAGVIPIMIVTGSIMRWYEPFPLDWRTGATFVHDWTAVATWLVVVGHVLFALSRPPALRSMLTGRMSRAYARDHHPQWDEVTVSES
jgi:formate dehydrogenase subunit gamma